MSETHRPWEIQMTDTSYDFDTGTFQCTWCFSPAGPDGCDWDHEAEEENARIAEAQLLDPAKPSPVLNMLECAEGPLTAMELAGATHLLVETVEAELVRLEAKGLVSYLDTRRWIDRLRSVPSI
jgi:hypothetical protein